MPVKPKYKDTVSTAMMSAAALGLPGVFVPALDMGGMATIWTAMITSIANKSGHEVSANMVAKLVAAAGAGVSAYLVGSKILTWLAIPLILTFPIAGIPAVAGINGFLNGLFTYRLGLTVSEQMSRPGFTKDDFLALTIAVVPSLIHMPSIGEIEEVRSMLMS
jgi:hypothetical protein